MAKRAKSSGTSHFISQIRAELPLVVGVVTTLIFYTVGRSWLSDFSNLPQDAFFFVWVFAVMVWCAFGVVRHADGLAVHLGEPYGTLILTISAVAIEVTIMATVMLDGKPNPTLPRDTIFSVLMIVLNGIVGISILVGAVRHVQQDYNLQGATAFLAVISALAVIALIMPAFTQAAASSTFWTLSAIATVVLTVLLYGAFLAIQTVRHRVFFVDVTKEAIAGKHRPGDHHRYVGELRSPLYHATMLILTLLPVVLLSKPLAKMLDFGIEQLGAPAALGGIVIAILVLSPEGVSSYRAAGRNELQRSVNLSLGSALSTIGLTVPVMLTIAILTDTPIELGLEPDDIALLALTLFLAHMTFSGVPTNVLFGVVHLVLFMTFIVLVFKP